ncbi:MAG TPA: ectonucleotide pyrophosphatase/phosphodiesterase [Vicinamibacterales bacterium]|nr:ectonucleotide pyrophosphatase/phosphodiesterase [Vicinamibacterales bacterium]
MRLLSRLLLALILACATLPSAAAADDLPRVLMISIDGLPPARYTAGGPAKIPTLRRLMSQGIHADGVVGIMPTLTYPSHTTLITGVTPAVHGIPDNRIVDPEERSNVAWYWYAQDIKAPTLPMAARARGLRAGAIAWPVTVGMDLDYLVPEFWRSGSQHADDRKLLEAVSWPHDLIATAEQARERPFAWPYTDRDRTDVAKFVLRTYKPHVLLVHLIDLDSSQHDNGPDSTDALETLERIDGYVGELLQELASAKLAERTNVVVVSDHGFLATTKRLQPNAALKDAGLLTVDEGGRITEWQAYFHSSSGSGFIFLRDPQDAALRDRVHALLKKLQSDPANGIRRIWTRPELDALGAHPGASFGLDVVDGFYTGGDHDRLVAPSSGKGGHGFDPARPELRASFIAAGPAVTRRGSIGTIRMTQIAPTLARILGVGLSPQADQGFAVTK